MESVPSVPLNLPFQVHSSTADVESNLYLKYFLDFTLQLLRSVRWWVASLNLGLTDLDDHISVR